MTQTTTPADLQAKLEAQKEIVTGVLSVWDELDPDALFGSEAFTARKVFEAFVTILAAPNTSENLTEEVATVGCLLARMVLHKTLSQKNAERIAEMLDYHLDLGVPEEDPDNPTAFVDSMSAYLDDPDLFRV